MSHLVTRSRKRSGCPRFGMVSLLGRMEARLGTTREQEKDSMPRVPLHALIWSREHSLYELYTQGQLEQRFRPADEAAWQAWLGEVTSFAFQGVSGSLNVYQEARRRAGQYWYAYHATGSRTRKRYL